MIGKKKSYEKILFRGSSCYPISPADNEEEDGKVKQIDSNDQLLKILGVLGS